MIHTDDEDFFETPVRDAFVRIDNLAPSGFAAGIRFRFARPTIIKTTYSERWTSLYDEMNAALADPTIVWALTHSGIVRWSELRLPDPFGIFPRAAEHGLCFGAVAAVGPMHSKSMLCTAHPDHEFGDDELAQFLAELEAVHEIVGHRRPVLDIHIRVLEACALGLDSVEICRRLDISRAALKYRLSGARKRLGAKTNAEAVKIAMERNMIRPHSLSGNRM